MGSLSTVFAAEAENYTQQLDEITQLLQTSPQEASDRIAKLKQERKQLTQDEYARLEMLSSILHLYAGDYVSALNNLAYAETLTSDTSLLNSIALYQATSNIAIGEYQKALDVVSNNLSTIELLDGVEVKADAYLRLTNIYLELEAYQEVEHYAEAALELSRNVNPKNQCYALLMLAAASLNLEQYQQAYSRFTASRDFCLQQQLPLIATMSEKGLGMVNQKLGNYAQAEEQLNSALADYQPFNFHEEINNIHALLAELYFALKDYPKAKDFANRVMSISDIQSNVKHKKMAVFVLSELAYLDGDYQQAYEYLKAFDRYREQLLNETKTKAYAYQVAKFENAEKSREIKMLNKDRALYSAQQKVMELERYNQSMALMALFGCSVALLIFGLSMYSQKRKYKQISQLDLLTGIYNRGTGQDLAENQFVNVLARQGEYSVIMFDLDHFKLINDTLGHSAGDWVLKRVTDAVTPLLGSRDLFVRMGGEEFAIFLPNQDSRAAIELAERCRLAISQISGKPLYAQLSVSASFGVCSNQASDLSLDPLMTRSDLAMYSAKHSGRNCVVEYQSQMSNTDLKAVEAS
ncbi:diguanylate cyclase [Shewanella sp. AS1]|uniref:diguanylate cyclase n=1 Tax=Shewanella sp. AS1 TaxID=2907626 RepID=UPI001F1C2DF6|nr:GGDEF domain-containing protein [Shewanella sp. AS1]MCE9679211.1 diguanylate cyclase [Shewanella sp. AS1]